MRPYKRSMNARHLHVCFGCLKSDHTIADYSAPVCSHCTSGQKHHSLLCFRHGAPATASGSTAQISLVNGAAALGHAPAVPRRRRTHFSHTELENPLAKIIHANDTGGSLLATALIRVRAIDGQFKLIRAVCDTGAQANLITESCMQMIGAVRQTSHILIDPVGEAPTAPSHGCTQMVLAPLRDDESLFRVQVKALILTRITSRLPAEPINIGLWPQNVQSHLADPYAGVPGPIDMLLGAHVWSIIAQPELLRNTDTQLTAQRTHFGWLLFGGVSMAGASIFGNVRIDTQHDELLSTLNRFWELENVPEKRHRSAEEKLCEKIFAEGVTRNPGGRYCVPIPLKPDAQPLGTSRMQAMQRFHQMEAKFRRNPQFKQKYVDFMNDYFDRGHMQQVNSAVDESELHFFVPHHAIDTGKFRVVFDGWAVSSSGQSFNDVQLLGERLQDNLAAILSRMRTHRVIIIGDIQKMYRQVKIPEAQHKLQLILWRDNEKSPIRTFALTTVTYGMKYAPHSAVRALQQCAIDHRDKYPKAAEIALRDFYMDDLITGADDSDAAIELYHKITQLLAEGQFPVCKWTTNDCSTMSAIDENRTESSQEVSLQMDDLKSVLGTRYLPARDELQYIVDANKLTSGSTKRMVTSDVAKLFDPNGYLAAVTIRGKIILRELCLQKLGWDDQLNEEMLKKWRSYASSLTHVGAIRIPRWIGSTTKTKFELHAFSDASMSAYASVVYARVITPSGEIRCNILGAKAKVAPMKATTISRLELSGAVLSINYVAELIQTHGSSILGVKYWCDSTIVLAWIAKSAHLMQTFVANRVARIQENSSPDAWQHVSTGENPADYASRGMDAVDLVKNSLWWNGPRWLSCVEPRAAAEPLPVADPEEIERELKKPKVMVITIQTSFWISDRYSAYTKLYTITAVVIKCVQHWKSIVANRRGAVTSRPTSITVPDSEQIAEVRRLSRSELIGAQNFWLRNVQGMAYAAELKVCLTQGAVLPPSSALASLSPFVHSDGLLRVGGRLQNACMSFDEKHPIILPTNSMITKLMIRCAHRDLLHGGAQLTTHRLRERYWIIGGRNEIRHIIHDCVSCKRHRSRTGKQRMAPLVKERVNESRPFTNIEIDYCGPFQLKRFEGKCRTMVKCYVAVFVCMATRAIHLELIHDMTTDAFIDGYRRFAARRGHCAKIVSDNGLYFVGAKRRIDEVRQLYEQGAENSLFKAHCIEWTFITPRAPWQGGSHESAVKLFKHHLKREMGGQRLSVLQFESLMMCIEPCLNSRPLGVMRDDAGDEMLLSPAHFLIGGSYDHVTFNSNLIHTPKLLTKWQNLQYADRMFWKKWHRAYLNDLNSRNKWKNPEHNLQIGDIVLITIDNCPPQQWPFGRIIQTHPGNDGLVRNVTVQTNGKPSLRAVQRLIQLVAVDENSKNEAELQAVGC